jgi:hypothetical protein
MNGFKVTISEGLGFLELRVLPYFIVWDPMARLGCLRLRKFWEAEVLLMLWMGIGMIFQIFYPGFTWFEFLLYDGFFVPTVNDHLSHSTDSTLGTTHSN